VFAGAPVSAATVSLPKPGDFSAIFTGGRALPTALIWISSFLALLILYLLLSWLPTLLVGNGFTAAEAAAAQIAFNVGGGCAVLLVGPLLERTARNKTIVTVFMLMPVTVLLLSRAPHILTVVVAIVFVLGAAVIAGQGYLYAVVPGLYPAPIRGVGVGAMVAIGRAGSIVGPKLGGALKAAGHGASQLLVDILPLVIACSTVALLFAYRQSKARGGHAPASD
jgi:AAHS family 3-hydroxyphenylpropionic acid transporter